jgi:hypothetical protein
VLHENIQTDTHDSIEDARCALKLYKAYHEFEEQGVFDKKLEELYKQGKQYVRPVFLSVRSCWAATNAPLLCIGLETPSVRSDFFNVRTARGNSCAVVVLLDAQDDGAVNDPFAPLSFQPFIHPRSQILPITIQPPVQPKLESWTPPVVTGKHLCIFSLLPSVLNLYPVI